MFSTSYKHFGHKHSTKRTIICKLSAHNFPNFDARFPRDLYSRDRSRQRWRRGRRLENGGRRPLVLVEGDADGSARARPVDAGGPGAAADRQRLVVPDGGMKSSVGRRHDGDPVHRRRHGQSRHFHGDLQFLGDVVQHRRLLL